MITSKFGLEIAACRHAFFDQPDATFHFNLGEAALPSTLLLEEEAS